jgi:UDP:flavonoid glycosyltransferase YjiC (YdhE family)
MPPPVLCVAGPALGHLARVLTVAEALHRHEVPVHIASDGQPWLPVATARAYPVTTLPGIVDGAALARGSLALPDARIRAAVDADLALLCRLRPRVILLDWRPSMRLAAAIAGIPVVALVNAHMTPHTLDRRSAPAAHPLVRRFGQRVGDWLMPLLEPLFHRQWARPYQRIARSYGQPGWRDFREYLLGDCTLYPDLPLIASVQGMGGLLARWRMRRCRRQRCRRYAIRCCM